MRLGRLSTAQQMLTKGHDDIWIWLDYISVPQPGFHPTTGAPLSRGSPEYERSDHRGLIEASEASARFSYREKQGIGQGLGQGADINRVNLIRAVRSIPGYVERSSSFFILCPGCKHVDSPSSSGNYNAELCYATWRTRGWCRLELASAALNPCQGQQIVVIRSPESTPELVPSYDAMFLHPAEGKFTYEADRAQVLDVMRTCVERKVETLFADNTDESRLQARFLLATAAETFLRCSSLSSVDETAAMDAVQLRAALRWRGELDDKLGAKSGMTLLRYAVLARATTAVRELLPPPHELKQMDAKSRRRVLDAPLTIKRENPPLFPGFTLLHHASIYGNEEIMRMLIKAGASTRMCSRAGVSLEHAFCTHGDEHLLHTLHTLVSDVDWNKKERKLGAPPIGTCLEEAGPDGPQRCARLLALGAKLDFTADIGATPLMMAMWNESATPEGTALLLQELRARGLLESTINQRLKPKSLKWKRNFALAILKYKMGVESALVVFLARSLGATALHLAAARGDAECMRLLIGAGARTDIRNSLGLDVREYSRAYGPFASVEAVLNEHGAGESFGSVYSKSRWGSFHSSTRRRQADASASKTGSVLHVLSEQSTSEETEHISFETCTRSCSHTLSQKPGDQADASRPGPRRSQISPRLSQASTGRSPESPDRSPRPPRKQSQGDKETRHVTFLELLQQDVHGELSGACSKSTADSETASFSKSESAHFDRGSMCGSPGVLERSGAKISQTQKQILARRISLESSGVATPDHASSSFPGFPTVSDLSSPARRRLQMKRNSLDSGGVAAATPYLSHGPRSNSSAVWEASEAGSSPTKRASFGSSRVVRLSGRI